MVLKRISFLLFLYWQLWICKSQNSICPNYQNGSNNAGLIQQWSTMTPNQLGLAYTWSALPRALRDVCHSGLGLDFLSFLSPYQQSEVLKRLSSPITIVAVLLIFGLGNLVLLPFCCSKRLRRPNSDNNEPRNCSLTGVFIMALFILYALFLGGGITSVNEIMTWSTSIATVVPQTLQDSSTMVNTSTANLENDILNALNSMMDIGLSTFLAQMHSTMNSTLALADSITYDMQLLSNNTNQIMAQISNIQAMSNLAQSGAQSIVTSMNSLNSQQNDGNGTYSLSSPEGMPTLPTTGFSSLSNVPNLTSLVSFNSINMSTLVNPVRYLSNNINTAISQQINATTDVLLSGIEVSVNTTQVTTIGPLENITQIYQNNVNQALQFTNLVIRNIKSSYQSYAIVTMMLMAIPLIILSLLLIGVLSRSISLVQWVSAPGFGFITLFFLLAAASFIVAFGIGEICYFSSPNVQFEGLGLSSYTEPYVLMGYSIYQSCENSGGNAMEATVFGNNSINLNLTGQAQIQIQGFNLTNQLNSINISSFGSSFNSSVNGITNPASSSISQGTLAIQNLNLNTLYLDLMMAQVSFAITNLTTFSNSLTVNSFNFSLPSPQAQQANLHSYQRKILAIIANLTVFMNSTLPQIKSSMISLSNTTTSMNTLLMGTETNVTLVGQLLNSLAANVTNYTSNANNSQIANANNIAYLVEIASSFERDWRCNSGCNTLATDMLALRNSFCSYFLTGMDGIWITFTLIGFAMTVAKSIVQQVIKFIHSYQILHSGQKLGQGSVVNLQSKNEPKMKTHSTEDKQEKGMTKLNAADSKAKLFSADDVTAEDK